MAKLLKNLHWIIISIALFNFYQSYTTADESYTALTEQDNAVKDEVRKNKRIVKEISNYYSNIKEEKERIERVAKEIEKMQQLLPGEISDSENINLLRKLADDINIKELSITPETDADRGFFIARRYRLKAKATYLQFLIMFEKISENRRILNIGESAFKVTTAPQRGKFQVIEGEFVLEAYKYNSNFKEDRGIEAIEKKFLDKSGGATPKPRTAKGVKSEAGE